MDWFNQTVPVKRVTLIGLLFVDSIAVVYTTVKSISWIRTLPENFKKRRIERKYSTMTIEPQK